jgi:hypothetical protein
MPNQIRFSEVSGMNETWLDMGDGTYARQIACRFIEVDGDGDVVPTWLSHTFTYDNSGNLSTDTIKRGDETWVRSYTWMAGAQTGDSGWVKNNG